MSCVICHLLKDLYPIGSSYDGTSQSHKDNYKDDPAPNACAGAAFAKAEIVLQPIEEPTQQKEFC
jgi:hypothetical protein